MFFNLRVSFNLAFANLALLTPLYSDNFNEPSNSFFEAFDCLNNPTIPKSLPSIVKTSFGSFSSPFFVKIFAAIREAALLPCALLLRAESGFRSSPDFVALKRPASFNCRSV